MATTKLEGNVVHLGGTQVNIGDKPTVVEVLGKDFNSIKLGGTSDKVQLFLVVPSLDTPVCAAETREFNKKVATLEFCQATVIAMDLPFAMARFCGAEDIQNVQPASDFRDKSFSSTYGVILADGPIAGIMCRAVFVLDKSGQVTYKQICDDITDTPNYEAALAAVTAAKSN